MVSAAGENVRDLVMGVRYPTKKSVVTASYRNENGTAVASTTANPVETIMFDGGSSTRAWDRRFGRRISGITAPAKARSSITIEKLGAAPFS